jgi:pimeloyl-ACP methyl ester carboxylesterase
MLRILPSVAEKVVYLAFETRASNCSFDGNGCTQKGTSHDQREQGDRPDHWSWFVYGDADRNIPPAAFAWMAKRAASKETVVVKGASHVVMVSNPGIVADLIEKAARAGGVAK